MMPLNGVRVLELAGPEVALAGRRLADLGAEVIKIEPPTGDVSRDFSPWLIDAAGKQRSCWFEYYQQGKRSLELDLEQPEAYNSLHQLVARADVLLAAGVPEPSAGLDYATLSTDNPGLVYAIISGYGQTGPWRDWRATDFSAAASGGQLSVCGLPDRPLKPYGQPCYHLAGYYVAIAVMLALRQRERSGRGQLIDVSLQEVTASALDHVLPRLTADPADVPRQQASRHWNGLFVIAPCADDLILISPLLGRETLARLIRADGLDTDLDAGKWGEQDYLRQNIAEAEKQIIAYTKKHSAAELMALGQTMRLPWAVLATAETVVHSPQLKARDFFVQLPENNLISADLPVNFSEIQLIPQRAPRLGEDGSKLESILAAWQPRCLAGRGETVKAPLTGLRVLDFSRVLAGPYATRLLADYGAEVIQVTSQQVPGALDMTHDSYYQTWNRGKRSIRLNLSHPEGRDLVRQLAAYCDVMLENFTPRVLANWDLNYPRLALVNPGIILVSLSGFGQTGPWRDYAAFGPTLEALSGFTALTAFADSAPLGAGFAISDHLSGLTAVWAVLTALAHRDRTGRGQQVDISEYELMVTALGPDLMAMLNGGVPPLAVGNQPEYLPEAMNLCCRTADGRQCALSINDETDWMCLYNLLVDFEWTREPIFKDALSRRAHAVDLECNLDSWTQQYSADELVHRFQAAGLAAAAVNDGLDLLANTQLAARGFFTSVVHPVFGKIKIDRPPLLFSRIASRPYQPASAPGADDDYVYGELLGLTRREIRRYIEEGVID